MAPRARTLPNIRIKRIAANCTFLVAIIWESLKLSPVLLCIVTIHGVLYWLISVLKMFDNE